ncbi:MAG: hypothetical protein IPH04_05570 [Saprospirales bacterium]|nr:hypothetical protein [Saprospirales bacterium]
MLIKIGIYGILRMILLVETDYLVLGFLLLFMGVISGLCGVMLAILQHNLKNCWPTIALKISASSE